MDTKDLNDIPELWPQIRRHGLPTVQYTAREVVSGLQFIGYAQERSLTYARLFARLLVDYLQSCGVSFRGCRIQTDNGAEFVGSWNAQQDSAFTQTVQSVPGLTHQTIPPGAHTWQADVETVHRIIEDELYEVETFSARDDFLQKATTYNLWFNLARKNSYKNHQSPWEIVKTRDPTLAKEIVAFPPLFLDELFVPTLQDQSLRGYDLIPHPFWRITEYPVYAPYNLSGINKRSLSETALDRSFPVEMQRKPQTVKKARYKDVKCEEECREIRRDLYFWALQNAEEISRVYESKELEEKIDSLALNDRAEDIWLPLFAILQVLGLEEDSPEWEKLTALAVKLHRDPETEEIERQLSIIQALRQRANGDQEIVGVPTELKKYLEEMNLEITDFSSLMKEWGFEKKSKRLPEYKDPRVAWVLPVKKLDDIAEQLTESLPYTPKTTTTTTTAEAQLDAFCTSGDSPGKEGNDDR